MTGIILDGDCGPDSNQDQNGSGMAMELTALTFGDPQAPVLSRAERLHVLQGL